MIFCEACENGIPAQSIFRKILNGKIVCAVCGLLIELTLGQLQRLYDEMVAGRRNDF